MQDPHAFNRSLDIVFSSMRPLEEAVVVFEPGYAFNDMQHGDIPPEAVLRYTIKLDSFELTLPKVGHSACACFAVHSHTTHTHVFVAIA